MTFKKNSHIYGRKEWIVEYADFVEVDYHTGSANLSPQDHLFVENTE